MLKTALITLALESTGNYTIAAEIAKLKFGENFDLPIDFRFNDVPHATWMRAYMNDLVKEAVIKAIYDDTIPNKSRMQLKLNFPEVNPAFDTYRIGTILELVRHIVLCLILNEGKKVRVLVQQSLGEGVFTGLPLALASMRIVLEKMDWGQVLTADEKAKATDNLTRRSEALIRFGALGKEELADDDDVILIICPQNIIGASIMDLLEETVITAAGRPLILINPLLEDRPSSNNVMQIRGRSDRRAFADSFVDICAFRLLYPSSGGYMFPIRGLIVKKDYRSCWAIYNRVEDEKGREIYEIIGTLPPQPTPSSELVSKMFTG